MRGVGALFAAVLTLTAADAWASRLECERHLLDRVLSRVTLTGPLADRVEQVPAYRRARLVFELKPEHWAPSELPKRPRGRYYFAFGHEAHAMIEARVLEMAKQGYRFEGASYRRARLQLDFTRDERLVRGDEAPETPDWVAPQREGLRARYPKGYWDSRFYASKNEVYYEDRPDSSMILTSKTIDSLPAGVHAFVLLRGENFLRLGSGHHLVGAREVAQAAGDIVLVRDSTSGRNRVQFLSPRSDTYRPTDESLVLAVEALWSQGIFPQPLQLREWNNRTILITL